MIDIAELKIGDHVHYKPSHYKEDEYENGIVKSIQPNQVENVFVVYNCNGQWHDYKNYTAACTNLQDLFSGWRHD